MHRRACALAALCLFLLQTLAVAAPPPEVGVTDRTILIGQSAALSGPAQDLGTEMRLGAQLYFESVNAQGGINGRRIELKSYDDGYEPERTLANTKKLIEQDKVFVLFGYVGTPTSNAVLPLISEARIPFIGAFTGAESLRTPMNRHVFNVRASYFDETESIVEQFAFLGLKNIAVFYQNDAYGQAGLTGVERAMGKRNMKITASGTVERNSTEVAAAVKAIHTASPDMVVMISAYKSCAAFIKAMKQAGSTALFYSVSFVGSRSLARELGPDGVGVGVSQVMPFPWASKIPVVREYQKLLKTKDDVSFTSLEGFIAAKILVEGIRRAGADLTREKLITAMESMKNVDVGGFVVSYSPRNRNGSRFVELTMIGRDGSFKH
jgi:ABC-type branched-subunit amino acid transport system substrate-binding protein